MKKIFALLCMAGISVTNAYAGEWTIYFPGRVWVPNDSAKNITVKFLVKSDFMNENKGTITPSDKVSFLCNDVELPMQPETWMTCETEPGKIAGIKLAFSDYKNGASGSFESHEPNISSKLLYDHSSS